MFPLEFHLNFGGAGGLGGSEPSPGPGPGEGGVVVRSAVRLEGAHRHLVAARQTAGGAPRGWAAVGSSPRGDGVQGAQLPRRNAF